MALFAQLRSSVAELKAGRPGSRFCDYHVRKRAKGRHRWVLVVGWILIALGALFSLVPGIPGIVLAIPGAALLAAESRFWARTLDWLEVRLRRLLGRIRSGCA